MEYHELEYQDVPIISNFEPQPPEILWEVVNVANNNLKFKKYMFLLQ